MRILVVSLLRLGDIILTTPVLKGLRSQYPDAEIELMINSEFKSLMPMIPFVDRVHCFERRELQEALASSGRSFFEARDRLSQMVEKINRKNYDIVFNLTHNYLTGWLLSLIDAKRKVGLAFDDMGRANYGSPWFRYLNEKAEADGEDVFHFVDVFGQGSEINEWPVGISLKETTIGIQEAESIVGTNPTIALQVLTSDTKKNWGLENFYKFIKDFYELNPQYHFVALCSPAELPLLTPWHERLMAAGLPVQLVDCSLETAFSILKRSDLLVTGDTSVKHLAAAAQTRILEISIGSSDYKKTGAYSQKAIIVQSLEACAPCVHSQPCHRSRHFCATRISADFIVLLGHDWLRTGGLQFKTLAQEYKKDAALYKVDYITAGHWVAIPILEDFSAASVHRWVELFSTKIQLNQQNRPLNWVQEYAADTERLHRLLARLYPEKNVLDWKSTIQEMQEQSSCVESWIQGLTANLQNLRKQYDQAQSLRPLISNLITFRERIKGSIFMNVYRAQLDSLIEDEVTGAFVRHRKIVSFLSQIRQRNGIKIKILRALQVHLESKI